MASMTASTHTWRCSCRTQNSRHLGRHKSNPRYHPFVFVSRHPPSHDLPRAFACACPLGRGGGHNQLDISSWELPPKGKLNKGWARFNGCPNQMIGLSCPWSSGRAGEVQDHRRPGGISYGLGMPILYALKALNKCPHLGFAKTILLKVNSRALHCNFHCLLLPVVFLIKSYSQIMI